jgi:integrase
MPRTKLSQHVVDRLPAPTANGKQTPYWDDDLKGFAVLCSGKTTAKTYIVQRDLKGSGNSRRVTIASTAELKFAEAKDRGRKLLLDMRDGKDPKAKPRTGTLQETLEAYLLANPRLSPRSVRQYTDLVRIQLASLKNKPLSSITPQEVDALHRTIEGKTSANHALQCLRMLHRWAAARDDDLGRCPVRLRRGEWHRIEPRRNPIPAAQLKMFFYWVQQLPDMGKDYITLCLFTGMRRKEAAGLRWSEVDFDNRIIRLSASRVKTRNAVDLPMTDVVFNLLVARRQLGDAEFVFPSRAEGHISGDSWTKALCQKTGLPFSMHDTRRTYATVGEACGVPWLALKALLNHSVSGNDITLKYIGMDVERLRAPAQQIADRLKLLCGITAPSGNVAVLRGALPTP